MDDLISEFLIETHENLDALDLVLVKLEKNPNDRDLLFNIFRLFHTIKGSCAFLGLKRLEKLAHHSENVLEGFRNGALQVSSENMALIFESIDRIKLILKGIEETGEEPEGNDSALIDQLNAICQKHELSEDGTILKISSDKIAEIASEDSQITEPLQQINELASELRKDVINTGVQPIATLWSKYPQIIRDLSLDLKKNIALEMRGQETEIDSQILKLIKDPLKHILRNCADHGIEDPLTRTKAGKSEAGKIMLSAFQEGKHIIIEIADDGRGLALDKIKDVALKNSLASESELEKMSPEQITQFIFDSGFSTADKVTLLSGRGVGMDIVRTNVEKMGATIELESIEGQGSTFSIKIPIT